MIKCLIHKNRKINQAGFTLIEMSIAFTITLGVALAAYLMFAQVQRQTNIELERVGIETDVVITERQLWNDFRSAQLALNNLIVPDDNGRNFYDYVSDQPIQSDPSFKRKYSVTMAGAHQDFLLMKSREKIAPTVFDPVSAYVVGAPPVDINTAATLTYDDNLVKTQIKNLLGVDYIKQDTLLFFYTPLGIRERNASGRVDMSTAPKWDTFLGSVNVSGSNVRIVKANPFGIVRTTHPMNHLDEVDSLDSFLRKVPMMGGGPPIVFVVPVEFIKYKLITENSGLRKVGVLYRQVYWAANTPRDNGQVVVRGLKQIDFFRSSINLPVIGTHIITDRLGDLILAGNTNGGNNGTGTNGNGTNGSNANGGTNGNGNTSGTGPGGNGNSGGINNGNSGNGNSGGINGIGSVNGSNIGSTGTPIVTTIYEDNDYTGDLADLLLGKSDNESGINGDGHGSKKKGKKSKNGKNGKGEKENSDDEEPKKKEDDIDEWIPALVQDDPAAKNRTLLMKVLVLNSASKIQITRKTPNALEELKKRAAEPGCQELDFRFLEPRCSNRTGDMICPQLVDGIAYRSHLKETRVEMCYKAKVEVADLKCPTDESFYCIHSCAYDCLFKK